MKIDFLLSNEEVRNAVEHAYSAGYKQGSIDGREGVMINPKVVSEIFLRSIEGAEEENALENIA
jgi:hypothetical protein